MGSSWSTRNPRRRLPEEMVLGVRFGDEQRRPCQGQAVNLEREIRIDPGDRQEYVIRLQSWAQLVTCDERRGGLEVSGAAKLSSVFLQRLGPVSYMVVMDVGGVTDYSRKAILTSDFSIHT